MFRYSKRAGTPAAERSDQIAPEESLRRSKTLQALARELTIADAKTRVDSTEQVLIEQAGYGTTESYHAVHITPARMQTLKPGELVTMSLHNVSEEGVFLV